MILTHRSLNTKLRNGRRWLLVIPILCGLFASSSAQSFNVDLNTWTGGDDLGAGPPSDTFGGAANQSGYWNPILATGSGGDMESLFGLDGAPTGVTIAASGGIGAAGGYNNHEIDGDYRLLMADYALIGGENDYLFAGLESGEYLIYTYCVNPRAEVNVATTVTVPGATEPVQMASGSIPPGNLFVQGVTHTVHELHLTGSSFEVDILGTWPYSVCNGFQIVEVVPEPSTLMSALPWLLLFLKRKRRR